MLNRLLKSRRSRQQPAATIPPGERVYAIGDIHGCVDLLDRLLAKIVEDDAAREPATTTLIFLGDLVDRGPDSAAVIERLHRLHETRPNTRFLLGNHEEIFLGALDGDPKALRLFCRIGGRETVISYGLRPEDYDRMDYEELVKALQHHVPASHRTFVSGFEDMIVIGDYIFVHAGVRPDVALDAQRGSDLRWIRDPFLHHGRPLEKIVVHGHTISDGLDVQPHRIGVDTGAYTTGRLTALALEGGETWTLEA
ncbi:metallophosphoesterase family protein [Sphingomonas sp. GV3]|uniref:metallophosphoesterase family protein n=1 Tax=Sphingomonas sp. GV3 TaxID=3040671 RepID=UPI00280BF978|nr:metallophosphoesterase family protein [Sphingomonas sp. GV3]